MTKSVLIIYTGGTIGMVNDPATGALCPFDFEQIAKAVPEIREFGFSINSYTGDHRFVRFETGTLGRPVPNHSGQIRSVLRIRHSARDRYDGLFGRSPELHAEQPDQTGCFHRFTASDRHHTYRWPGKSDCSLRNCSGDHRRQGSCT